MVNFIGNHFLNLSDLDLSKAVDKIVNVALVILRGVFPPRGEGNHDVFTNFGGNEDERSGPFPSCPRPLFQGESACDAIIFTRIEIRTNYHSKNVALRLALK